MNKIILVLGILYLMYKSSPLYGINFKDTARIRNLRPEIIHALSVARTVFITHGSQLTVTDAWRDDPNSLHYHNLAIDLRAKHINYEKRQSILSALQTGLGTDFQVILHGVGQSIHYHIEYDPLRIGIRNFMGEKEIRKA